MHWREKKVAEKISHLYFFSTKTLQSCPPRRLLPRQFGQLLWIMGPIFAAATTTISGTIFVLVAKFKYGEDPKDGNAVTRKGALFLLKIVAARTSGRKGYDAAATGNNHYEAGGAVSMV